MIVAYPKHPSSTGSTPDAALASVAIMQFVMAGGTESYQVLFAVRTGMASELNVMDLQVPHASADLASPTVSFEDLPVKHCVAFGVDLQTRPHLQDLFQEAFP